MTMSIISPTTITPAILASSSATDEFAEWNPATSYALDAKVKRATTNKNYICTTAGISAVPPETNTLGWVDIGPTNTWGMFDRKLGTSTRVTSGNLTVVLNPGRISGVALLGMEGALASITIKDSPGGNVIRYLTKTLDGTIITSVYEWFFSEYQQLSDWAITGLPAHYLSPEVTIVISSLTGAASCGVCLVGNATEIGYTQAGASAGIFDYSRKVVDDFGNYDVTERAYSKRNTLKVFTARIDFNKIFTKLASIRATPAIYIGVADAGFEPFLVYGWYKSFDIVVEYPDYHLLNIEIEGLI